MTTTAYGPCSTASPDGAFDGWTPSLPPGSQKKHAGVCVGEVYKGARGWCVFVTAQIPARGLVRSHQIGVALTDAWPTADSAKPQAEATMARINAWLAKEQAG